MICSPTIIWRDAPFVHLPLVRFMVNYVSVFWLVDGVVGPTLVNKNRLELGKYKTILPQ